MNGEHPDLLDGPAFAVLCGTCLVDANEARLDARNIDERCRRGSGALRHRWLPGVTVRRELDTVGHRPDCGRTGTARAAAAPPASRSRVDLQLRDCRGLRQLDLEPHPGLLRRT